MIIEAKIKMNNFILYNVLSWLCLMTFLFSLNDASNILCTDDHHYQYCRCRNSSILECENFTDFDNVFRNDYQNSGKNRSHELKYKKLILKPLKPIVFAKTLSLYDFHSESLDAIEIRGLELKSNISSLFFFVILLVYF
jgi:hypothetical protein